MQHDQAVLFPIGQESKRRVFVLGAVCALTVACLTLAAAPAQARVKKIQVTTKESPTFGGYSWPGVGQYRENRRKGVRRARSQRSEKRCHRRSAARAEECQRQSKVLVRLLHLKPIDLTKGNHKMLYEPPNRGGKTIAALNRGVGGNDPGSVTDPALLANAFLMPQGYSISFSGWDLAAGTSSANFNTTITLPIARNPDGSPITGPSYKYIVNAGAWSALTYPTAALDQSKATLTHRVHLDDTPQVVPASGWQYDANGTTISLLPAGTSFVPNDIYEFTYTAKNPTVNGVGFAAVRDWNAWLRSAAKDDDATANPLAGDITRIYTEVSSNRAAS